MARVTVRPASKAAAALNRARRNGASTPCQTDFAATGNARWAEAATPHTHSRRHIKRLAAQCREHCPVRDNCFTLAKEQKSSAVGVWGGMYFRYGAVVDPFKTNEGSRRSVFRRVYWDTWRGQWKAEAQRDYEYYHIGYFHSEDEAGAAVDAWEEEMDAS